MKDKFTINVVVNGNSCKQYSHEGKTFIEAKAGTEYEIHVKTTDFKRHLAIISVDGINVLDGSTASPSGPGYVFSSHTPLKLKGYRYSDSEVGAFKFCIKEKSYAKEQTSVTANCGVIGICIIEEDMNYMFLAAIRKAEEVNWNKRVYNGSTTGSLLGTLSDDVDGGLKVWCTADTADYSRCINNTSLGAGNNSVNNMSLYSADLKPSSNTDEFNLGTQWGNRVESKVTSVDFKRGSLVYTEDIYYSTREGLKSMGVPLETTVGVSFPQSFPGYCKPPIGWKR